MATARLLDGKTLAATLRAALASAAAEFSARQTGAPGLTVIIVGDDPASAVYVRNKHVAATAAGFDAHVVHLPADATLAAVLDAIDTAAQDPRVHGLLVQLPLPAHLDVAQIQERVPPEKDVDGLHPVNAGRLALGRPCLAPCTPRGALALLDAANIALAGAEVVVVGRSSIVGKPAALMLLARNATVTLAHSKTRDLAAVCRRADILVSAVGIPGLIRAAHVKPGAAVIDVGIVEITDRALGAELLAGQPERLERFARTGRALVGDVHFGEVREVAGWLTPVPGGVGPLTIAMLLDNTLQAARAQAGARR